MAFLWSLHAPHIPLALPNWSTPAWIVVLGAAYLAGHIAQALGNLAISGRFDCETLLLAPAGAKRLPTPIIEAAQRKVADLIGADAPTLDAKSLYRLCDHAIARHGDYGDRDVFIYREGLYRGLTISFLALAVATLARGVLTVTSNTPVRIVGLSEPVGQGIVALVFLGMLAAARLCHARFKRFCEYRVAHAIIGMAVMQLGAPGVYQLQEQLNA